MSRASAEGMCLKHTRTFMYNRKDKYLINDIKKSKVSQLQLSY